MHDNILTRALLDSSYPNTGIVVIVLSFGWLCIGFMLSNFLYDGNTYLTDKYMDRYSLFGKWNILFILSGPLVLIDCLITLFINRKKSINIRKQLLSRAKFKIDDRVVAVIYNYTINGKIVKVKVKDYEIFYNLEDYNSIDFSERNMKLDRKTRINNIYN